MQSGRIDSSSPSQNPSLSETPRLPFWARAADATAIVLVALAVSVYLFGGFRSSVAGIRIRATSSDRLWLFALFLVVVRHGFIRRMPLPVRAWHGARQMWNDRSRALSVGLGVGLSTRLSVILVGLFAVATIGFPITPAYRVSANELVNLSARFDSGWYLGIASEGYAWNGRTGQQNVVFFPAFPTLMWFVGVLMGARPSAGTHFLSITLNAGVLISVAAFVGALSYLYKLAREDLDDERATAAAVLLAAYPFAVFYSAAYTESLFLLSAVGALYHMRREGWLAAGAWGILTGLTKPNGCLLSLPLAMIAVSSTIPQLRWLGRFFSRLPPETARPQPTTERMKRLTVSLLAAAGPGIGMLMFSAYLYHLTGDALRWVAVQQAWGREYRGFGELLGQGMDTLRQAGLSGALSIWPVDALNFGAAAFAVLLIVPITWRLGWVYGIFTVLNVIPPLLSGGWSSMGRYTSVVFPIFFFLASVIPARHRLAWASGFAIVQGLFAAVFYTWRPLY